MIRPIRVGVGLQESPRRPSPSHLYDLTAALRRRTLALLHALAQRRAQEREAPEPLRGLQYYLEHRVYKLRVSLSAHEHGRLVRESADGLQTALHRHQAELSREVVRVHRFEPARAALFEEEEAALAHLGERGQARAAVEQERDEVVRRGPHARVLIVDYPQTPRRVHHYVRRVKVPVAERPRARGQLRRHVIQLGPQLRLVAVLQSLAAQAPEVVLHEEVQLPRELRLVEGQTARD